MIDYSDRSKFRRPEKKLVLPVTWEEVEAVAYTQRCYDSTRGIRVILTEEFHDDQWYLHCSVSRRGRLPDWNDIFAVKNIFVGPDLKAVIVLPKRTEYVNLNPHVMHMFCPLERDPLPDFRGKQGGMIAL